MKYAYLQYKIYLIYWTKNKVTISRLILWNKLISFIYVREEKYTKSNILWLIDYIVLYNILSEYPK